MKITEAQLRKIIRKELIKENKPRQPVAISDFSFAPDSSGSMSLPVIGASISVRSLEDFESWKSNFLEKYYRSAPIGITVEGSNTLTRSLIIFGQGLNKSHPYIFPILESILKDDVKEFMISGFSNMVAANDIQLNSMVYKKTSLHGKDIHVYPMDIKITSNFENLMFLFNELESYAKVVKIAISAP